jgi:hypothetical protein
MKAVLSCAFCLLGLSLLVAQLQAHHAFAAEFDANKVVKLEGTVVQMEWVSPHAWLTIETTNTDNVEQWSLEFGPPNLLFRKGYRKTSLMPGMHVKVVGFASKDGQHLANVDTVTLEDGRTLKGESNAQGDQSTDPATKSPGSSEPVR